MQSKIRDVKLPSADCKIEVPVGSRMLRVVKIGTDLHLYYEVWGYDGTTKEVSIICQDSGTYIRPESVYIDTVYFGGQLVKHFFYIDPRVEDLGGDGGEPDVAAEPTKQPEIPKTTFAGGIQEC